MKNKLNKITIVFLMLILAIPIFSFSVEATVSEITTDVKMYSMDELIAVRSNGDMFALILNYVTGPHTYANVYISTDNGASWTLNKTFGYSMIHMYISYIGVDGNDNIHIFHPFGSTYGTWGIRHEMLSPTGVWSSLGNLWDSPYQSATRAGAMAVLFDSDNMYVTWGGEGSSHDWKIYNRNYNFVLESWGSQTILNTGSATYPVRYPNMLSYNDDIYVFYTYLDDIRYNVFYNSNSTWVCNCVASEHATNSYYSARAVTFNNKICLFYQGQTDADPTHYSILYKNFTGGNWSSEMILHSENGYNLGNPDVSINSNGNLNVVWQGKSSISSANNQIMQRIYSSGSWSTTAYITSGAISKVNPDLFFQEYPVTTWLVDGLCMAYCDDTNDNLEYIDSGSLIWYDGIPTGDDDDDDEGEGYSDFDFEANDNIGTLDTGCIMNVANKDIEFNYQVPTTINATGFDLLVGYYMYSYDDNLTNYDLFINGASMGNPTEWKQYSGQYVLRWTFPTAKVITNSEILFELWHDKLVSGYSYWLLGVSCNYEDLDGDGIATMRYSNTYPNGVFDGTWLAKDVAYQLYFNTIAFVEDETDVTYNSISTNNVTCYNGETVSLTYTIKSTDLVYDNYVRIWNDDTATEISMGSMQGFPHLCDKQVKTVGFVPFASANYSAYLYINSVAVDNVSFFVDEHINSEMYVFTNPNPTNVGQKIWVKYKYDHPTNKSGAIFVSLSPNLNSYTSVNYLSDGDSGFWTCTHDYEGTYYYIMAVDIDGSGTYGIVNNGICKHTVLSEHGNNYFTLGGYGLRLNEQGTVTQNVNGECNLVTGNCYIYDNNQLVKTITESPFSYTYEIHTAGHHSVEMRLITNVTTVLCTQNYSVTTYSGEDEIEQVEDSGLVVRDYIYNLYGDTGIIVSALAILLTMTLLPLIIVLVMNVKYNKNIDIGDIHWSIYIVCAIIGVVIDVQLQLIDLWVILLLCIGGIAIIVAIYYGRS